MVYAVITGITLLVSFRFILQSRSKKLPPLSDTGIIKLISILSGGKGAPDYYYSTMKKEGLVFRLPMPELSYWVVVCDPALARKILIEEDEKPALYSRYTGSTNYVQTVFTSPTHGHSWPIARKGMAPSFSMANLILSLPKMYEKINELNIILARHESEKTIIDLPELMAQLALDFICAGESFYLLCFNDTLPYDFNQIHHQNPLASSDVWCRSQDNAVIHISRSSHDGGD